MLSSQKIIENERNWGTLQNTSAKEADLDFCWDLTKIAEQYQSGDGSVLPVGTLKMYDKLSGI